MDICIERKWEWIARLCRERGYEKAEQLAYKIDSALILLYGLRNSRQWGFREEKFRIESGVKDVTDMVIYEVANSPNYCIACCIHSPTDGCRGCEFGKTHGRCNDVNSLFGEFLNVFEGCMDIVEEEEE
jgi:hypothetical protein